MKFIITESRITNLIFDYLNSQAFYKMKYEFGYVFWQSKESWESGGYISINANRVNKECFVNSDLLVEVSSELYTSPPPLVPIPPPVVLAKELLDSGV